MPQERARPKLTITVDSETVTKANHLVSTHKAKNTGCAFDMVMNHYFLTCGALERREQMEKEVLEKVKVVMSDAMKEVMDEMYAKLTVAMQDVIRIEIDNALKLDAITHPEKPITEPDFGPPMEPEIPEDPAATYEQLIRKCPGQTPKQVEDWTGAWKEDIQKTGHTVDEFIAAKVMRFARTAKPVAVAQAKIEDGLENKKADAMQKINWAMVDLWLTKKSPKTDVAGNVGTKEFHVAHAIEKLACVVRDMDNGSGEAFLDEIDANLKRAATERKWEVGAFMDDYNRITMDAANIKERYKDTVKK